MSKPYTAHATETGVRQWQLAKVTGALDVLEGSAGMGAAMSDAADWVKRGLGGFYNIGSITFKITDAVGTPLRQLMDSLPS